MPTYEALAANYLLRRMTGSSQPRRDDLHNLLRSVIHRRVSHVVEDRELDFCLLLGYSITRVVAGKRKSTPQNCFLYTPYKAQSRHMATQQDVVQELGTLGIAEPARYISMVQVGETLVFYWNDELCIVFQRLARSGRWARRHFPLAYFTYLPLMDFTDGLRAGLRHRIEQYTPNDDHELPFLEAT